MRHRKYGRASLQVNSEAARLRARIAQQWAAYQKLPRRAFVGTNTETDIYAPYVKDWVAKVEQVARDNYPESARRLGKHDRLHLTVSIQADGKIEKIEIDKPSKHKALNDAARQNIEQAAPFAAFTSEMRRHADILSITRSGSFTPADQSIGDK